MRNDSYSYRPIRPDGEPFLVLTYEAGTGRMCGTALDAVTVPVSTSLSSTNEVDDWWSKIAKVAGPLPSTAIDPRLSSRIRLTQVGQVDFGFQAGTLVRKARWSPDTDEIAWQRARDFEVPVINWRIFIRDLRTFLWTVDAVRAGSWPANF